MPPDAGEIDDLIAQAKTFQKALVYQTVGELEDSYDIDGMLEAGKRQNHLARKISEEFASLPFVKSLHLGAGGCRVCPVCAKRTGEPCRYPERAMSSPGDLWRRRVGAGGNLRHEVHQRSKHRHVFRRFLLPGGLTRQI